MFCDVFNALLEERDINSLYLSREIGVPKSIIYEWKKGVREPSMENLIKLSDYFGVSVEQLIGRGNAEQHNIEEELLVLLRAAKDISEEDHNALVNSFKANIDTYLKTNTVSACRRAEIEDLALSILLKLNIEGEYALSFLDCRKLILDGLAFIDSISSYEKKIGLPLPAKTDGITVKIGGLNMILYDDTASNSGRTNWTIAHELGHIVLSHTDNSRLSQNEADLFAASFLMPSAVIHVLDMKHGRKITEDEMANYFSASQTACRKRRLNIPQNPPENFTKNETELLRKLFG